MCEDMTFFPKGEGKKYYTCAYEYPTPPLCPKLKLRGREGLAKTNQQVSGRAKVRTAVSWLDTPSLSGAWFSSLGRSSGKVQFLSQRGLSGSILVSLRLGSEALWMWIWETLMQAGAKQESLRAESGLSHGWPLCSQPCLFPS